MTAHAWETLQRERAREAAAATVHRLERALAELETELDFRRVELGEIVAARHARGARLFDASQRGACLIFGGAVGSPSTASAAWDGVPPDAVRAVATHIAEQPRWDAEETAALGAVSDLEQRVLRVQRHLAHWRLGAGTPDSPVAVRAPAGPPEPVAETAKAAAALRMDHEPFAVQPPALGAGSLSVRARLASLADRVAGW